MAKISIIIPVYNVEDYLDVCLNSILAQSFTDFEVICVNDDSTDSSPEILEKYAQFDNRIKVHHIENGGAANARNYGMEHITGEYTTFIDSDDWVSHLLLERMYKNITEYDSDFNFCGVRKVNNFTKEGVIWQLYHPKDFSKYVKTPVFCEADVPTEFIYMMHTMIWGKLYRSEFIKNIRFIPNKIYEDNPFFIECYLKAKKISYDHSPLYYYRVNRPNSVMKTKSDRYRDIFDIADNVKTVFEKYSKYKRYKTDYMLHYITSFLYYTISIPDEKTKELSFNLIKERMKSINPNEYNQEKLEEVNFYDTIYIIKDMSYPEFNDMMTRKLKEIINGK